MNDLTGELVRERHDRALEAPHDPTRQVPMSPIRQPIGQFRQRRNSARSQMRRRRSRA